MGSDYLGWRADDGSGLGVGDAGGAWPAPGRRPGATPRRRLADRRRAVRGTGHCLTPSRRLYERPGASDDLSGRMAWVRDDGGPSPAGPRMAGCVCGTKLDIAL